MNSSGTTYLSDMTALYAGFGTTTWLTDLNVDGVVNIADVQTMVTNLFRTVAGDFNLDGQVDMPTTRSGGRIWGVRGRTSCKAISQPIASAER